MGYSHEIILPNEDISFKLFIFEGKDGKYFRDKHWHRAVEIFAVLEGELKFYIDEEEYPLKPGDFMLVNSNEIHAIDAPEKNRVVVLQIPYITFERYYIEEKFIYFKHSIKSQDEEVLHLIAEMYETYERKMTGYELKVQSLFYSLVYLLVCKYRVEEVEKEKMQDSKKRDKLYGILNYMKEHYAEELTLESVSERFGYSPTYLSRMFKKCAGLNFKSYLNDLRLKYAYKELADTNKSIGKIAVENGFASSKAFSTAFQNKYGMLPSEFRKRESVVKLFPEKKRKQKLKKIKNSHKSSK